MARRRCGPTTDDWLHRSRGTRQRSRNGSRCGPSESGSRAGGRRAAEVRPGCNDEPVVHDKGPAAIVTGLLRRGGQGLLVHRAPTRRWYPDCWDLPGGHLEDGETPDNALRRELAEELGVAATIGGPPDANFRSPTFRMAAWVIDDWEGEPTNLELAEHDAIAWMSFHEIAELKLAHQGLATLLRDALS